MAKYVQSRHGKISKDSTRIIKKKLLYFRDITDVFRDAACVLTTL